MISATGQIIDRADGPTRLPGRLPATHDKAAQAALSRAFEAAFLAQMLDSAGLARPSESFGGGAGEAQMRSFLLQEKARALSNAGGLGLAETVFRYLSVPEKTDVSSSSR